MKQNPFITLQNDVQKIIKNKDDINKKVKDLNTIYSRNYSGKWLFKDNTEKFLGNGVAQEGKDCPNNPYYLFYLSGSSVLASTQLSTESKITLITEELDWLSNTQRLDDWIK